MDVDLIRVFFEVVSKGSFTAAAASLEVPKSTVSRRLSRLESELGVQLLVRTTRKLRLTDAGELFYKRVAPALEELHEATNELAEQQVVPQGTLRVSSPPDYESLPRIVAEFVSRYPLINVEVEAASRYVDLVGEGFDVAIRAGNLQDSTLIAHRIATITFHLFASRAYLERAGEPTSLSDLSDHRCVVLRRRDGNVPRWTLDGPRAKQRVEPRANIVVNDLPFVQGAVSAGAGIGLLPRHVFENREDVCRVLPEYEAGGAPVSLVYPGARHVPTKVRAFRDHVLKSAWFD